jgi:Ran GTPase-activating protein (RanGAP) involved in mRNA processing and transport
VIDEFPSETMSRRTKQDDDAPIVYIRRLRAEEVEALNEDLQFLLPCAPLEAKVHDHVLRVVWLREGDAQNYLSFIIFVCRLFFCKRLHYIRALHTQLFCVAPNRRRSNGVLLRAGRWQDNNFVIRNGVQMLILHDGIEVDFDFLCRGMVSEEIKESHRAKRKGKLTHEEMLEDAKEDVKREKMLVRQSSWAALTSFDAFVVENRVLTEDQLHTLAKWVGARDSSEHEACHCLLKRLHLVNVMLGDDGCKIMATCLPRNKVLEHIDFGYNAIGDVGCAALFRANIGRTLSILKLGRNALGDVGCKTITPLLASAGLIELHLHNNFIGDKGVKSIAQGLGLNATLRVLNLNGNRIRDAGAECIAAVLLLTAGAQNDVMGAFVHMNHKLGMMPDEVTARSAYSTNKSLESLHLSSNRLQDTAAQAIAQVFQANCSLTSVELAGNSIGDVGAKSLAEALKVPYQDSEGRPVGRNLVLNCNYIGQNGTRQLQEAMKIGARLHSLSVEGMRVPSLRRAKIQTNSADPLAIDLTGSRKVPRIRLEVIHHERKKVDLEELVNSEFRMPARPKLSSNIKESFFPLDRFLDDHVQQYKSQPGCGGSPGTSPGSRMISRGGAATARLPSRRSLFEDRGSRSSRISTQTSQKTADTTSYTQYLMNSSTSHTFLMNDDTNFQNLCHRLKVAVEDTTRDRLNALDERQRDQRAKIYDRLLDIQTKFHRPLLTSAIQVQSMFRMRQSCRLATSIRRQNEEETQELATEAKLDLAADRNDGIHDTLGLLIAPGKRRSFTNWCDYVEKSKTAKEDIFKMYAVYCTNMGVSACGTSMLKKFVLSPYNESLSLQGSGISPSSARALSFLFMGVESCKLCRGSGTMTADVFKGVSTDPMSEKISAGAAFRAVDLDDSGFVDASELLIAFKHLGLNLNLEEVEAIMTTIDEDKSGQIDRDEFELLFKNMTQERGPGQCVLCHGKGQTGKPCHLEEPYSRRLPPLLDIRVTLGHNLIEELVLSNNCLRASGAKDLVNIALMCGPTLKTLRVSNNELEDGGATAIALLFRDATMKLVECDLSGNKIGDSGMLQISNAIKCSKSIRILNLSSNLCTGTGSWCLGEMIVENESLRELDISWNGIGSEQASGFWKGLQNSRGLQKLHASWNGFCDLAACRALSAAIQDNTSLNYLDLSHNRLTETCCEVISEGFALNETLIDLHLDGNPLGINGAKTMLAAADEGAKDSDYTRTVRMENCSVGVLDMSMFDPSEPAGRYMLDMQNESARQVLRNILRLVAQNRASLEKMMRSINTPKLNREGEIVRDPSGLPEIETRQELYVLECFMTHQQFWDRGMADSDPMKWKLPEEGMLEFNVISHSDNSKFGLTLTNPGRVQFDKLDAFFIRCMQSTTTCEAKIAELETFFPSPMKINFLQFKTLFDILKEFDDDGCALLVETWWHRVQTDPCRRAVIALLSEEQRHRFLERNNQPSFDFMKDNPSGHYHLNLDKAEEKNLANLLLDAKAREAEAETMLKEYSVGRKGGARDLALLEARCWRNCTLNNVNFPFKRGWRMPASGILSLDFVKISKPDPDKVYAMSDGYFHALIKELSAEEMTPAKMIASIKTTSNNKYWTCAHILKIMECFPVVKSSDFFQPRVELLVTVFGRTIDWLGLTRVYDILFPFERKMLAFRLGEENMFAEAMAVNYYELDLADAAQRYVMQELLHIAVSEEGENFVEFQYQGCDYKMPASWVSEVPQTGKISLFYTRTKKVIEVRLVNAWFCCSKAIPFLTLAVYLQEVILKGTCDKAHPNPEYHPAYFSEYVPEWLSNLGQGIQVSVS